MTDAARTLGGIGALAEPVRRALYECVVASAEPLGREQAAEAVGVPLHTAKFHLDRLVDDGLGELPKGGLEMANLNTAQLLRSECEAKTS